ncbi:MAG: Wzz/FepE/Etk N-terminal domain-containing protein [Bacillota bacterium]|nr:Wzz/FepE/Etk N-terminal domain-containing protein [Bacillota bacterium]
MNRLNQSSGFDKRKAKEINLKELFRVIKKRFWILFVFTILFTAAGILYAQSSTTKYYQTSSRVIIGANEESRKTLQVIVTDSTILDKVVNKLHLTQSAEELAGEITVASIDSSQVVSISVVDSNPKRAADIANTTAEVFKDQVPKIVGNDYIRILSDAKINLMPINKNPNNKIIVFLVAGIIVGIGFVFLLDSLDDSIQSESEIELLLNIPVLGKVSKVNKKNVKRKRNVPIKLEVRGETNGYK